MNTEYTPEQNPLMTRAQIGQALECAYIESSELEDVIDNVLVMLAKVRAEAKAEAYKDAECILHEEARWQLDLHQRHKEYRFKHCSERMTEMENCMTVRANQYKEQS